MGKSDDTRERWSGDVNKVFRHLKSIIKQRGKSFIRYSEAKTIKEAQLDKDAIRKAIPVLQVIRAESHRLPWKRKSKPENKQWSN